MPLAWQPPPIRRAGTVVCGDRATNTSNVLSSTTVYSSAEKGRSAHAHQEVWADSSRFSVHVRRARVESVP